MKITASVNVSEDPQVSLLVTVIVVGVLLSLSKFAEVSVYKDMLKNILDMVLYFNLLALSAFSWYHFRTDVTKQTAVAYTSTIITFILLVGAIIYHVYLIVKKEKRCAEAEVDNEYSDTMASAQPVETEVTYTVIEIPKPLDLSPASTSANDSDESEIR